MNLPSIALIGKTGAGKTTLANELTAYGYHTFSWAGPVKAIASWAYGEIKKAQNYEVTLDGLPTVLTGRQILQRMATEGMRTHVDNDFWVKVATANLDSYPEHAPWVCDDTRFNNEYDALVRRDFVIIRVLVPDELREQRLKERDGSYDPAYESHASETLLNHAPAHLNLWNTHAPSVVAETLASTLQAYRDSGGNFTRKEIYDV